MKQNDQDNFNRLGEIHKTHTTGEGTAAPDYEKMAQNGQYMIQTTSPVHLDPSELEREIYERQVCGAAGERARLQAMAEGKSEAEQELARQSGIQQGSQQLANERTYPVISQHTNSRNNWVQRPLRDLSVLTNERQYGQSWNGQSGQGRSSGRSGGSDDDGIIFLDD